MDAALALWYSTRPLWTEDRKLTLLEVVSQFNPTTKKIYHASINACLAPLVSVDGKHVITVEGIGNVKNPHPAQERIGELSLAISPSSDKYSLAVAMGSGSQCGFCTPGIVMVKHLRSVSTLNAESPLEPICLATERDKSVGARDRGSF